MAIKIQIEIHAVVETLAEVDEFATAAALTPPLARLLAPGVEVVDCSERRIVGVFEEWAMELAERGGTV